MFRLLLFLSGLVRFRSASRQIHPHQTTCFGNLQEGTTPPDGFMCPSGWKILSGYYQSLKD